MTDDYQRRSYGEISVGTGEKPGIVVVDFQLGFTDRQYPLGGAPLVMRALENTARLLKVARRERIAQFVDDAAARERDKSADVFQSDVPFLGAEKEIEFLKLAPDRARVATGEEDEEIERLVVELQLVFPA